MFIIDGFIEDIAFAVIFCPKEKKHVLLKTYGWKFSVLVEDNVCPWKVRLDLD